MKSLLKLAAVTLVLAANPIFANEHKCACDTACIKACDAGKGADCKCKECDCKNGKGGGKGKCEKCAKGAKAEKDEKTPQ
jgi:hypothetical protein